MSALSTTNPTLVDVAKRKAPDGSIDKIVELLNMNNEVLNHMVWVEGNLDTGHKTTVRTGIPEPTWRKLYQYVDPTKSSTAQVVDSCGQMQAFTEVDEQLALIAPDMAAFRLSEDRPHIEGMSQELATALFFASEATQPEAFTGLAPRFNVRSGAGNSENVIHGGAAGTDNGSIWLLNWSEDSLFGIYPKGSVAGLQQKDLGAETATNGSGGLMRVLRSQYIWNAGLCVRDWRSVVRICNIDKSALTTDASGGSANLPELMFQALDRISNNGGRMSFYMSRDMLTKLRQQVANGVKNSTLTTDNVGGKRITSFQGVPISRTDVLAADETLVPAS